MHDSRGSDAPIFRCRRESRRVVSFLATAGCKARVKKKEKKIVEEPPRDTPGRLFAAEILVALFLPRFSERTRERISKDGGISALRRKQRDFCPRCSPLRFLPFFFSSFRNSREIYKCNARNNIFQSLQLLSIMYAARTLIVVLGTRYSYDFLIANA